MTGYGFERDTLNGSDAITSSRSTKHIRTLIRNPTMEEQQSVEEFENDHPMRTQKTARKRKVTSMYSSCSAAM